MKHWPIIHLARFIFFVVALQMLNMSILGRATDDISSSALIDDAVNIPDHALEFVVENLLGFSNAFPEKNEIKGHHFFFCLQKVPNISLYSECSSIIYHPLATSAFYFAPVLINYNAHHGEISHPPPETC